jgi:phosphohistidine phosphatase SixA
MPKRVVFIRHAQSEENVKFAALMEGVQRIGRFKLPRLSSVSAGFKLLRTDLNSSLSPLGKRQVLDQALNLREARFLDDFDPQLILVSPLDRAKDTLLGLLQSSDRFKTTEMVVLECLREATPLEHLVSSSLERRISEFQAFLLSSTATRILVCGHSQYFKRLLKMSAMMRNVDVWSATLDSAADSAGRAPVLWSNLKLEHRSALSPPHPMDKGKEEQEEEEYEGRRQHTVSNNNVVDDLHDHSDEPVCRICQASKRETPTSRFIRPCSCSGSLAHVHLECLNRWRATSASATRHTSFAALVSQSLS